MDRMKRERFGKECYCKGASVSDVFVREKERAVSTATVLSEAIDGLGD